MSRCPALVLAFLISTTGLVHATLNASHGSELQPASLNISELEDRAFEAVNLQRRANGLRPLTHAPDLSAIAREHSRDMIARHYFAHRSPEGADLRTRFARHGINRWRRIAENIAYNLGYSDPVAAALEGWMRSHGHRQNILDPRLVESGIGVAVEPTGRVYFTQVFATRDRDAIARR
jgi:uncharacterized protein YkwD